MSRKIKDGLFATIYLCCGISNLVLYFLALLNGEVIKALLLLISSSLLTITGIIIIMHGLILRSIYDEDIKK